MRLIDADKIIYYESVDSDTLAGTGKFYAPRELIDSMPTIEERKKGEWIEIAPEEGNDIYTVKCDQCGKYDFFETNFCPNCGADMRQGGQDE